MSTITTTQIERGLSIARREGDLRWEWADLALEVAPANEGGHRANNGNIEALTELREEIATNPHGDVSMQDLPSVDSLRHYRDAADAIPPTERKGVSVYVARELGHYEPSKAKRLAVIAKLREEHPRGRVTIDALRVEYNRKPTRTAGPASERVETEIAALPPSEKAKLAGELLAEPGVVEAARQQTSTSGQIAAASLRLNHEAERENMQREQVRTGKSKADIWWDRFVRAVQANQFGDASAIVNGAPALKGTEGPEFRLNDERRDWLRGRAEYMEHQAEWLREVAELPDEITDEALAALLKGD